MASLQPALSLCSGSVPHSQMTSNTIVTMTMASHSSHATAVTTSAIPVGECVLSTSGHRWLHLRGIFFNFSLILIFFSRMKTFSHAAKVVPQPITHSSSRVQPDYTGERTNLIPIPGHRSSPNPATMEARSDNRWAHTDGEQRQVVKPPLAPQTEIFFTFTLTSFAL